MARIDNKALFFTTSPRTPAKMIPEIRLLHELFEGRKWNSATQEEFIASLAKSDFFEGTGSPKDKAFSARDRINRAPKALGFVDLKPYIALTDAGQALISGKRPQEIFLRQLLKFQLPSPYHTENSRITGTFYVRPYLEIMRLIRELEYITFDELKIFAVQLTDYRKFDGIKAAVLAFRTDKEAHRGVHSRFVNDVWTAAVMSIYSDNINAGKMRTRETTDASLKKFIATKKSNLRDYADACFRYLRYTGLVSVSQRGRTISFFDSKLPEADYILSTVGRNPVFIDDETAYKNYLFSATTPVLYVDNKENIVDTLMRTGEFTKRELINKSIGDLKDLRDEIILRKKEAVISAQIEEIKTYALYNEINDIYYEILHKKCLNAPLMLEYNTWRAIAMLDGGTVKGNFISDDEGQPLATAQGNMPDIECDYGEFVLSIEVTMQSGQRQYETEGEPVARHYAQMKKRAGKEGYCLFVAPTLNPWALGYFYSLNKINLPLYGAKTRIIPLELEQFMRLVDTAYNYQNEKNIRPNPFDVQRFLNSAIEQMEHSSNETEWSERIQDCIDQWLAA
jgi:hypothetical protein